MVSIKFMYDPLGLFKVGLSPSKKIILFALIIVLKNDEKYFLFHLFGHAEKSLD